MWVMEGLVGCIYDPAKVIDLFLSGTMSGCTLQFTRNSPLRTTLIDEATGKAKYIIDTPRKIAGSVTQIRKLESDTQPPHNWDEESESDSDDDVIIKNDLKAKANSKKNEGNETTVSPGMSDEIAMLVRVG